VAALADIQRRRSEETFDRDWRNFVLAMVAAHPENSRAALRLLDRGEAEPGELAEELTEEEMRGYVPVQERGDLADKISELQTLGFAVVEG
jgi:hypothetical protein